MDDKLDELRTLWSEQKVETTKMHTIGYLDDDLRSKIQKRNWIEWVACAFVFFFFGRMVFSADSYLVRGGALEIVAASVYIAFRLWKRGRARKHGDPTQSTYAHLQEHRASLQSQAALLRRAPCWYVAPIFLGWSLIWVGTLLELLEKGEEGVLLWVGYLVAGTAVFGTVAWVNVRTAARLEKRAKDLE